MSERPKYVWVFDENRRVYPEPESGRLWASGGPIYREHWVKREIVGENRASWILRSGQKVPKRGGPGIAFSEREVDDDVWRKSNRYHIARALESASANTLRQVAELIGYKEKTHE